MKQGTPSTQDSHEITLHIVWNKDPKEFFSASPEYCGLPKHIVRLLTSNNIQTVGQMMKLTDKELASLHGVGEKAVREIKIYIGLIRMYFDNAAFNDILNRQDRNVFFNDFYSKADDKIKDLLALFTKINDIPAFRFSNDIETYRILENADCLLLSDIITKPEDEIKAIVSDNSGHFTDLLTTIQDYTEKHREHLNEILNGNRAHLYPAEYFASYLLKSFCSGDPFAGRSFFEITEALEQDDTIANKAFLSDALPAALDYLVSKGDLRYEDTLYYRIYPDFSKFVWDILYLSPVLKKLLLFIYYGLSGEVDWWKNSSAEDRNNIKSLLCEHAKQELATRFDGATVFAEEFYTYFYSTYAVDRREISEALSIPESVWCYMDFADIPQGFMDLHFALSDSQLTPEIREKLQDYLQNETPAADEISLEHREKLKAALTDDFYFIDEVQAIYRQLFPDADTAAITPSILRDMGIRTYSNYIFQHYSNLEDLFTARLVSAPVTNLTEFRDKYRRIEPIRGIISRLKQQWELIEIEAVPERAIRFQQLAKNGIRKEDLQSFCDAVYEFVPAGTHFTIHSLKQDGFTSPLFKLGFSDWFYGSLLTADKRFSYCSMYGNRVFYKGTLFVSSATFIAEIVKENGNIDLYALVQEMEAHYSCPVDNLRKVTSVDFSETDIYYDSIMECFYVNKDSYYDELDTED